jgi:hypothetical protein
MSDIAENSEKRGLGPGFWAPWALVEAALVGGFVYGLYWVKQSDVSYWYGIALVAGFTVVQVGLSILPQWLKAKRGLEQPMRPASRRYLIRFTVAMVAYMLALPMAITYWQQEAPSGAFAWIIALAPAIPVVFAVRAVALLLKEEEDGYWKARHTFAHTWATNAALALCTVYGFLDMFELVPNVDLWAVFPVWAMCLLPAQIIGKWRLG